MTWKTIRVGGVTLDLAEPAPDRITFVGSRKRGIPPLEFEELSAGYDAIARVLVPKGFIAVSGGADGMDRLAESAFGRNVVSYRTEHRDREPSFVRVLDGAEYAKAERMVASLHPAWKKVKQEHRPLHVRNMAQVLQDDLRHPTRFLVCWAPPSGSGVSGGTASAYELSRIVHGGAHTHNLATNEGKRGFANELRDMGIPVAKGSWYPRTQTLQQRAKGLMEEGHGRIAIAIPVGASGYETMAERINLSDRYATALAEARNSHIPSIIGDAWDSKVVLVAVPFVQRTDSERQQMISTLEEIASSNVISRIVLPDADLEPGRDNYRDFEAQLGRDSLLDSPFDFVALPENDRGLARGVAHSKSRGRDSQMPEAAISR